MEHHKSLLQQHPFFDGCPEDFLEVLAAESTDCVFHAGDYLCREGEEAHHFYILRSGRVSIELHTPRRGGVGLQTLRAGSILGWSWLVPPYEYDFDARAVELTRALSLNADHLRRACEENPALGYDLLKRFSSILVNRLRHARWQLLDLHGVER
jgi:CRP-like cAMP-binding protein